MYIIGRQQSSQRSGYFRWRCAVSRDRKKAKKNYNKIKKKRLYDSRSTVPYSIKAVVVSFPKHVFKKKKEEDRIISSGGFLYTRTGYADLMSTRFSIKRCAKRDKKKKLKILCSGQTLDICKLYSIGIILSHWFRRSGQTEIFHWFPIQIVSLDMIRR